MMNKNPQGSWWRRLDNTGKLFPVITNEKLSNVFRLSAVLTEDVVPSVLQLALEEVIADFDPFRVRLKRGFFWYYFERNNHRALIEKEATYPCKFIDPKSNRQFLFRVSYYQGRINLEVFHALTDGMGASEFLKALVRQYLKLRYDPQIFCKVNQEAESRIDDIEDSYLKNYKKIRKQRYSKMPAYQIKGEYLPLGVEQVVHGFLDLAGLKNVCKAHGVTITQYLTATLIWSVCEVYRSEGDGQVGINLPVNLRSLFGSSTMANFFAVCIVDFELQEADFQTILVAVCRQMKERITRERLEEVISYNVSRERKWYLRIVPLVVKWAVTNVIFYQNDRSYTTTLSNVGLIKMEPQYQQYIRDFRLMLGVSKRQSLKCGVCAYGHLLCFTFSSVFKDTRLQDTFFGFFERQGLLVETEGNDVAGAAYKTGNYPSIPDNPEKLRKLLNVFYAVLLAISVFMGVIHYTIYQNHRWMAITAVCICYVVVIMRYSIMRHANLGARIMVQILGGSALLVALDCISGYQGWSVDYGIPSLILFGDVAIIGLILINRLNWQSYFMYQIAVTVFSFIPMVLWAFRLITHPLAAIITLIVSVCILTLTIMLGDRSVKHELIRRFHL